MPLFVGFAADKESHLFDQSLSIWRNQRKRMKINEFSLVVNGTTRNGTKVSNYCPNSLSFREEFSKDFFRETLKLFIDDGTKLYRCMFSFAKRRATSSLRKTPKAVHWTPGTSADKPVLLTVTLQFFFSRHSASTQWTSSSPLFTHDYLLRQKDVERETVKVIKRETVLCVVACIMLRGRRRNILRRAKNRPEHFAHTAERNYCQPCHGSAVIISGLFAELYVKQLFCCWIDFDLFYVSLSCKWRKSCGIDSYWLRQLITELFKALNKQSINQFQSL